MKNEKKNLIHNLLIIFLIIALIDNILTQKSNSVTTINNNVILEYDGILGIGWGVFIIICSIFLGIALCIFGFSTTYQITFYFIGFTVPIVIFLIMVLTPVEMSEKIDLSQNQQKNPFIITRYLIMGLVATALITLIIPYMKITTIALVPQRVDSRSQREYLEKFANKLNDNPYNKPEGEENIQRNALSNHPQILSISNSNVNQIQHQDIEMANVDNLVNKERKTKLKALKRKRNEEDNII